jgi:hypothetical protein
MHVDNWSRWSRRIPFDCCRPGLRFRGICGSQPGQYDQNSLQYDAVNAGCAKDLAFATVSGAKNGDSPVAQVASKIVKALISNVTNRQYQMSDDNIYDQSVPAEDMNKQYINKITLPVNKIHYLKNK